MFLFANRQGKNREPGLQKKPVRAFIGRQVLMGAVFLPKREQVLLHRAAANAKIYMLIRDGVMVTRMPLEH